MPFYKVDTLEKVSTLTVTLTEANRSEAHYPLLGWKWFPNDAMAKEQLAFKFDPNSPDFKAMLKEEHGYGYSDEEK